MKSNLARLFALARDYDADPSLYQSRSDSYDITGSLYAEFISFMMDAEAQGLKLNYLSVELQRGPEEVLAIGFNFLDKIIFSSGRNYYEVMGVKKDVSASMLRKQYRYLIAMFHPDKCAACNINGETYAALLNRAYNTLKKSESRQAYDDELKYGSNINNQYASAQGSRVRRTARQANNTTGIIYNIPIVSRYPRAAVWSILLIGFSFMLYQPMMDTIDAGTDMSTIGEASISSGQDDAAIAPQTNQTIDNVDMSGEEYLAQSIPSEELSQLLGTQKVPEAVPEITAESQLANDVVISGSVESENEPAEIILSTAEENAPIQIAGFDGGQPGAATDIKYLLQTVNEDASSTQGKNKFPIPLELIMMRFIQSYETGNIEELSELFDADVLSSYGQGKQRLVSQYADLFKNTSQRRIQLKQLKIAPRADNEALLISDINAAVQQQGQLDAKHFNGEIIFRLIARGSSMQIAEIAHSVH